MRTRTKWHPVTTRKDVISAANDVVEELADRVVHRIDEVTSPCLADGAMGIAIFLKYLSAATGSNHRREQAYQFVVRAYELMKVQRLGETGLFTGVSGLAWGTLYVTNHSEAGYSLATAISRKLASQISAASAMRTLVEGSAEEDFDIVNGWSGIGLYLMNFKEDPVCREAIGCIIDFMTWLSGAGADKPRCFTPSELLPTTEQAESYPDGFWNFGLAHGILGPLAFLAKASTSGVGDTRTAVAVRALYEWMYLYRQEDEYGINWPYGCGRHGSPGQVRKLARSAWCYGSPGISRSLLLAGQALEDPTLVHLATEAMISVCRRPKSLWEVDTVGICHGLSGVILICLRFFNETGQDIFKNIADSLVSELIEQYNPCLSYGFPSEAFSVDDSPSLLTGAIGVGLALIAATGHVPPDWDQMLAIS